MVWKSLSLDVKGLEKMSVIETFLYKVDLFSLLDAYISPSLCKFFVNNLADCFLLFYTLTYWLPLV